MNPALLPWAPVCMGGFSLGCGLGWSAPCVEILRSDKYDIEVIYVDVIASIFTVGAAVGTLIVPTLIDRVGRKRTMLMLMPFFIGGWIMLTCAGSLVPLFVIGRILTGSCGGMFSVLVPMYTAEISEQQIRGITGIFFQLLLVIGILYAYCTGFTRSVVMISGLCGIPPVLFAILMFFLPESPLFYLMMDREEEARKSMRFFRGLDYDIEPEIQAFQEQTRQAKLVKYDFKIFLSKPVRKTLAVAYGLMFTQQFSGINALIFYGETILEMTSVGMESLVELVIFACVQVVACIISVMLIDKLGRKVLMLISVLVMAVCLICLGIFFVVKMRAPAKAEELYWLPLTSLCLHLLGFCLGAGPIPWAYMGEIFPTRLKGAASSSAVCFNWLLAFIITMTFPSAIEAFGTSTMFFFFAVTCVLSAFFVMFCMVETKDKSFAEIQEEFGTFMIS